MYNHSQTFNFYQTHPFTCPITQQRRVQFQLTIWTSRYISGLNRFYIIFFPFPFLFVHLRFDKNFIFPLVKYIFESYLRFRSSLYMNTRVWKKKKNCTSSELTVRAWPDFTFFTRTGLYILYTVNLLCVNFPKQ